MVRLLALSLLAALTASGAVVYSNTATPLGLEDVFADQNATEIGDQITLEPGGPRQLQSVLASLVTYDDAVTAAPILRIYSVASGGGVDTLLASSSLASQTFAANSRTLLTFTGWSLTLPEQLIWTLGFVGDEMPVLGVEAYSPPGTGMGTGDTLWWRVGGLFVLQSFTGTDDDYFLEIQAVDPSGAVPEPGTWALTLCGAALLLAARRR
ncbi:MAG: PEP-CTERM sorting domain-containing protein [Bryobacterales bacterium]|nr:PEP-CTERM sorting domain-containing protein [Bryobacterales bacterium]